MTGEDACAGGDAGARVADGSGRRETILREAARQFALKGIASTTVRDIADAVGVLSGSLYHYFPSKDDIVHAILSDYLDTLTTTYRRVVEADTDTRHQLIALIRGSVTVMESHPHASEIYQTSGRFLATRPRYANIRASVDLVGRTWMRVIEAGTASGAFRDDMPPAVVYRLLRDALWLSVRWFKPTDTYSTTQFADDLVSIYLEGMSPRHQEAQQ